MSCYSDFTINKTKVFKNDKRTSFWVGPLLMMEIRSEDPVNPTNKIMLDTDFTLVTNRLKDMCSDCFGFSCCLLLTLKLFRFLY